MCISHSLWFLLRAPVKMTLSSLIATILQLLSSIVLAKLGMHFPDQVRSLLVLLVSIMLGGVAIAPVWSVLKTCHLVAVLPGL